MIGDLRSFALFDSANSIACWFQAAVLGYGCLLLHVARLNADHDLDIDAHRWTVLSFLFLFLSVDKIANVHQVIFAPISSLGFGGATVALWLPLVLTVLFSIYLLPMLARIPSIHRALFFSCATALVFGAIVMDAISMALAYRYGHPSAVYIVAALLEETLETLGAAFFCIAASRYIIERWPALSLSRPAS